MRGKIVEEGSRDQIFQNPQHPYTQKLLRAIPKLKLSRVTKWPIYSDVKISLIIIMIRFIIRQVFWCLLYARKGHRIGLVGESGSGKSTIAKIWVDSWMCKRKCSVLGAIVTTYTDFEFYKRCNTFLNSPRSLSSQRDLTSRFRRGLSEFTRFVRLRRRWKSRFTQLWERVGLNRIWRSSFPTN